MKLKLFVSIVLCVASLHAQETNLGGSASGGGATDATLTLTDVTTNNASTSKHGFLPKLDNNSAHFLDGTGAWATPTAAAITLTCDGSTDNSTALQAAINNRTSGDNLTVRVQCTSGTTALISAPLSIPSKTTLILDPQMILKRKNSTLAAGGAAFAVNSDTVGGNADIAIYGGIWDGNNANNTRTDNTNVGGVGFRFNNVTRLRIGDLTIRNPNTFGVQAGNITDLIVRDIFLDYSISSSNQDGIHLNGPITGFSVRNIIGDANDDHVAINADDTSPYQMTTGTIKNGVVDGVYSITNGYRAVRFLSNGSTITNVMVHNIGGTYAHDGILFSNNGSSSVISNITFSGITGTFAGGAVYVDTNVSSLIGQQLDLSKFVLSASGTVSSLFLNGRLMDSVTSSTSFKNLSQATNGKLGVNVTTPGEYLSINSATGNVPIGFYTNGTVRGFLGVSNDAGGILDSSTVGDVMLRTQGGKFSLSTNGASGKVFELDTSATSGNTRMLLWDVDKGAMSRVSVGASDSGGAGFKLLRVPN